MKKIYLSVIILMTALSFQVQAQSLCGFDGVMDEQLKINPQYAEDIAKADSIWAVHQEELMHTGRRLTIVGGDTIYEIPTVIHVLHTGGAVGTIYNPADSVLENWIDYLNEVYAGTYPGYPQAGSGGVSLPVRFVLAKRDPDCGSTTGINRIDLSGNSTYVNYGLQRETSNGLTTSQINTYEWPTNAYYNLYVINKIDGVDGNCTNCSYTAGFAYLGLGSVIPYDGAYMLAHSAHEGDITLPHEIGHALGLYHVFNGGSTTNCPPTTGNCNNDDDQVCDTDPSRSLLGACPSGTAINPCTSMQYGSNGVQHNFMNYSQCRDHFTQGQADRMMLMLQTFRPSLINSNGALPPPATASPSPVAARCQPMSMSNPTNTGNIGPCNVFLDSIQYYSNGYIYTDNTSNSFYYDHTLQCALNTHTSLIAGDTYDLSVSTTRLYPQSVRVYIDYNNDGIFTPGTETVMSVNNIAIAASGDTTHTVSIVPPTTATLNTPLRMRVIADHFNNPYLGPCDNLEYGQAEDFSVTILPNAALDLGLTNFSGKVTGHNQALLSWDVHSTSEDIYAFELQRSADGRTFTTIAFIDKKENLSNYQYTDFVGAANSKYYYRLKLIGNTAEPKFSKIVALNFNNVTTQIKLFPNPVTNQLTIQGQNELAAVSVYDALGRLVIRELFSGENTNELKLDFGNLPTGIYLIRASDKAGYHIEQKITKK